MRDIFVWHPQFQNSNNGPAMLLSFSLFCWHCVRAEYIKQKHLMNKGDLNKSPILITISDSSLKAGT